MNNAVRMGLYQPSRHLLRGIQNFGQLHGAAEMNSLGVRGVRINVSPVKPAAPGFAETMRPRIERLDARCAELGWHLDFLLPGWLTEEQLRHECEVRGFRFVLEEL